MSINRKNILHCGVALASISAMISASVQIAYAADDEVIVTATKRAENIQDVPISITAYGAEFLEKSGVNNIGDVALYTPNFTIGSSSQLTNYRISIRGVGSVGNGAIEPSVGVFIDGVYYPKPGSVIGNLMDIQSFEILRGPQGTLFGRNTPMGALNITTKNPSFSGFEGNYELGYGSDNAYKIGAAVNIPLSENTALRIAGKYSDREGYGTNLMNGENIGARDDLNLRGKLLFEPTDALSIKLTADYGKINSGGASIEFLNGTENAGFLGTLAALAGPASTQLVTSDTFDHDVYQDHRDSLDDEQWGISGDISYELASGHTVRSITALRDWKATAFESAIRLPIQLFPRKTDYDTSTFSQEIQLLSPTGGTFDYLVGGFYYNENYDISQNFDLGAQFCRPVVQGLVFQQLLPAARAGVGPFAALGPAPSEAVAQARAGAAAANQGAACAAGQQMDASDGTFNQELSSIAVFAQGTYHASDQLSFTLGGRYTSDEKTADFTNTINNPFVIALSVRAPESHLGMNIDEFGDDTSQFTYFANASYDVNDDTMVFATVSTGFKSGGFNSDSAGTALTRRQRVFGPEDTTNYEFGVKTDLADGALRLNATLYRTDIDGYQDRSFDGVSFVTRNVGSLRQQGFEADARWTPIDQFKMIGGISYLDSEFLDYDDATPLPGGLPQVLTGARAHRSPKWQYSLVNDWSDSLDAFGGSEYFLRGELQYVGEQNVAGATNQNPQGIQEGYGLLNARVGLRSDDDQWEFSLWGKNLSDKGYCMTIFNQPFAAQLGGINVPAFGNTGPQRCAVGAPLTYGVELKFRH